MGFEPTISAGERPQTYPLDRGATGTGYLGLYGSIIYDSGAVHKQNMARKEAKNAHTKSRKYNLNRSFS